MAPSKREAREKAREQRRKNAEQLRSKSTGLIRSEQAEAVSNRKFVFDEEEESQDATSGSDSEIANDSGVDEEEEPSANGNRMSDDDGEVEEMTGSVARELAEPPSGGAFKGSLGTKKKRKRKVKAKEEKLDDFDEEFFERLEREELQAKQAKKLAKDRPRRTTFVIESTSDDTVKVDHDHNIQVVVINDSKPLEPISESLLPYSKLALKDGTIPATKRRPEQVTWKRSKTAVKRRSKYRNKTGKPAANFRRKEN